MSVTGTSEKPAYLDTSLSFAQRARDLVKLLTLEEKVGLMNHPANGVPRLNIPAYNYWNEALHGIANQKTIVFLIEVRACFQACTINHEFLHGRFPLMPPTFDRGGGQRKRAVDILLA